MSWQPLDSIDARLPTDVRAFAGVNEALPLRAWYVRIDERDSTIQTRVAVSDDPTDRRETVSSFAQRYGACVAVNGGYFAINVTPTVAAGLLYVNGRLLAPATETVARDTIRYPTARAAVGFGDGGGVEIGWVVNRGDTLYALSRPPENRPRHPAVMPALSTAPFWHVRDALGAGPMLVWNGEAEVTTDPEVFFGSAIPEVHPRTALGVDRDGRLILLVIDGRQPASRGATLEETATIIRELGAMRAMNLDGGGSSALVVAGILLNRPTGDPSEREVMSALVTTCGGS
jgi:exopolysaccharide biosynthesis protein